MAEETQMALRSSVTSSQCSSGLFQDRSGHGDLYYTLFGLILALITDAEFDRRSCAKSLKSIKIQELDAVHAIAHFHSQNILKLSALPKLVRKLQLPASNPDLSHLPDSAFPQGDRTSPYSAFLQNDTTANLAHFRLPDGLYSNLKHSNIYGINATAAALCLHQDKQTAQALRNLQNRDGSFSASADSPCGDLLSTATAVYALKRCGFSTLFPFKDFLRNCFRDNGMFSSTPDDSTGDLEYTVYGFLAMGELHD